MRLIRSVLTDLASLDRSLLALATSLLLVISPVFGQNIGIGTTSPMQKLHIQVNGPADGIRIDNVGDVGSPILQYRVKGTPKFTMGVDDADNDKFKIGTTTLSNKTVITIEYDLEIGIRTNEPSHMFHIVNGEGSVGANSMAAFENEDQIGVALASYNKGIENANNAFEGVTYFENGTANPAGVLGLAIAEQTQNNTATIGVVGHSNLWQGIGVVGSRRFDTGPDNGFGGQFYYDIGYTGGLYSISDQRTKSDVVPLSGALSIVNQLNPVAYHYDTGKYPYMGLRQGQEYGFLAQEVKALLPEITAQKTFFINATDKRVPHGETQLQEEEFLVIDYTRLIPILTQAIKEQQSAIENLQSEVQRLREELERSKEED